jgi:protein-arginine kinase activator protein McsA
MQDFEHAAEMRDRLRELEIIDTVTKGEIMSKLF